MVYSFLQVFWLVFGHVELLSLSTNCLELNPFRKFMLPCIHSYTRTEVHSVISVGITSNASALYNNYKDCQEKNA